MRKQTKIGTGKWAPTSGLYRAVGTRTRIALSKDDRVPPNNGGKTQQWVLEEKA